MVFFKILLSPHLHKFLTRPNQPSHILQNPPLLSSATHFIYPQSQKFFTFSSFFHRPISSFPQSISELDNSDQIDKNENSKKEKKPLAVLFQEAVGLTEKVESSESENENDWNLKKNLKKLEKEVRRLNENSKAKKKVFVDAKESSEDEKKFGKKSLSGLFQNKKMKTGFEGKEVEVERVKREEAPMLFKALSEDMEGFVSYLYKEGYFKDANFLPRMGFDITCFEDSYGRDYIKYAAVRFGKDHQEIAKWLSGSDLKSVAVFGCPTLGRKDIFTSKRLRTFFEIQEDTVCSKCILRGSCKFPNQNVWRGDSKALKLDDVMRVITLYALEAVHPQIVLPEELKSSVNRLLKEVLNLSKTIS